MESLRPRRLTEFLGILWRRKKLLLLMAVVMLIATLIVIRRIPSQFESRALVIVNLRNSPEDSSEATRFATLQQELVSRNTLASLVRKHSLYPATQDMDESVGALQRSLTVETRMRTFDPEVPDTVLINHRYGEPKVAQAVVTDLVKMLEQGNERMRVEAEAAAARLTGQIVEVENRLKELSPMLDLDTVRIEALSRSSDDSTAVEARRQIVQSSIETLGDNQYALQRRIGEQRNQIAEHEKLVKSLPASPGSAAYGTLLAEKSKTEAEIKTHSDHYTDKHPRMIQLRNQLSEINHQVAYLETQPGPALPTLLTPEGREVITMQRDLKRMEGDLDLVQRQLQRRNQEISGMPPVAVPAEAESPAAESPASGPTAKDMARTEYGRLVIRYNWLLDNQDSMLKLSGAQGPAHMMFYVIDAPNLPRLPVAPNRFTLQLLALGVAIAFGLLIALAVELPRMFTISDDRDVEYFLGAPVLALIPETLTPAERARKRKLRMTRGLVIMSLAVALAPILVMLLTYLKVFQIVAGK